MDTRQGLFGCLLACCLVSAATTADAQDVAAPYAGPLRALVYSDRDIPDSDRARLVELTAQVVPLAAWRGTAVEKGTSLDRVVDCFYDAYDSDPRSRLTAAALKAAIQQQDPLLEWPLATDTHVRMLPFPAVAERTRDRHLGDSFRIYDTLTDASAVAPRLAGWSATGLTRIGEVAVRAARSAPCGARLGHRNATYTAVVVRTDGGRESLLRQLLPHTVGMVTFVRDLKFAHSHIQLLGEDRPECLEHGDYLETSPFWDDLKARVAQLRSSLPAAAADFPLVIVDQNFSQDAGGSKGHGATVRAVAARVLEDLGVPELTAPSLLINEELCPTDPKQIQELKQLVAEVLDVNPSRAAALRDSAETWFKERGQPCAGEEFDIPDVVLAAVLKKSLRAGRWMTLSFRAKSAAAEVLKSAFIGSRSVSLVAAGNDVQTLDDQWAPHGEASFTSRVMLVTYGDDKGVYGTFSSPEEGLKVDITAPGCGIGERSTVGSSLATPLVAVGVWLKELMRRAAGDQPADDTRLRSEVTAASRPTDSIGARVEAAGMFDLSRYVMAPLRYVHFRPGALSHQVGPAVVALDGGLLRIHCDVDRGGRRVLQPGGPSESFLHTLVPGVDGRGLLWRKLGIGFRRQELIECRPDPATFSLEVIHADGASETLDWRTFTRDVLEVSF